TWFAVSFRMVVSQLHSTRHLQTMSLCLFAKLILPDQRIHPVFPAFPAFFQKINRRFENRVKAGFNVDITIVGFVHKIFVFSHAVSSIN
ncbi:hypothetical protein PNE00_25160, partial [Flavonifractor plautii]|uniref:hypothetical protein n=1 Tax=Flavonifractor plautii TaxID=292800 RepID=UPI00232EEFBF